MFRENLQLIDEQTSPLHRIMWVYNPAEPSRRAFENNICAFHIGNGYVLTVAHNLRTQAGFFKSIDEELYKKELLFKMDGSQKLFFDEHFFADPYTRKLYLNHKDEAGLQGIVNILRQKRFDTRWETLAAKKVCEPYFIIQFRNPLFYNDSSLTSMFAPEQMLYEPGAGKHTFMVNVELVKAFYGADIALYRMVNTPAEIIARIPSLPVNTEFFGSTPPRMHCLQSSPASVAGRLLNDASIEGILDHFTIFRDEVGGNYTMDGYRYLVKGYFRFGSSGAPYVFYDERRDQYVVNGIQSEASGIQLTINNERDGNFQYVNAIVSPLHVIGRELAGYGISM